MQVNSMILTLILFVPLAGAAVLALLPRPWTRRMQWGALAITLVTFFLTLHSALPLQLHRRRHAV